MILTIVAIHDRAADAYMRPVFVNTIGQAIRSFQDEINNDKSELYKHPDDYDLYLLGEYNDNTGHLESLEEPEQIAIGKQLKTTT